MVGWFSRRLRRDRENGAALVEFAFVLPFLLLLFLGIVEFGYGFAQVIDINHKAREAGRLAVVANTDAFIEARICAQDLIDSSSITSLTATFADTDAVLSPGTIGAGDEGSVTVTATYKELTGLFGQLGLVPSDLSSTVGVRLEQIPVWDGTELAPCP